MSPNSPRVHAIVESGKDAEIRALLHTLNNVRAGRLVCDIPPRTNRLEQLQNALLQSLGKSPLVSGIFRSAARKRQRTHAWLRGERIQDLIVSSTEELKRALVGDLLNLAANANVRLWLLAENEQALRRRLPEKPAWLDADSFLERWTIDDTQHTLAASEPFPKMGYADGSSERSAWEWCRGFRLASG